VLPPPFSEATVQTACLAEWALHLDDVMIRRTSWRYYHREHLEQAAQAAAWMAPLLEWDDDARRAELDRYRRRCEN
ncbi:MAG TPA: glycerol-3-phosphate dehydrogenase C-terminal domain-containing protein, partial [Lacipirellulaceae bacterium]|nr:glycerol-3-phosphate dehydrogenase C-terminal domain-containing protein [Lacipirellulaceae bacterium]